MRLKLEEIVQLVIDYHRGTGPEVPARERSAPSEATDTAKV